MASTGQLYIVFLNMLAWNLFSIQFGTGDTIQMPYLWTALGTECQQEKIDPN